MQGGGGVNAGVSARPCLVANAEGNIVTMTARRVLILEDSLIIAMEAEEILHEMGAETVEIASNLEQAVAAIQVEPCDFALLDVNLGEAMSFGFARLLKERNIPFGFVSGYSDTRDFPVDLQDVALLVKPFDEAAMLKFLRKLFAATA
jgi:CheY-like chemotaxis protein